VILKLWIEKEIWVELLIGWKLINVMLEMKTVKREGISYSLIFDEKKNTVKEHNS